MVGNVIRFSKVNVTELLDNMYMRYLQDLQDVFELVYKDDTFSGTPNFKAEFNEVAGKLEILRQIKLITDDECQDITLYAYELLEMYENSVKELDNY